MTRKTRNTFGSRLRATRELQGLSQTDLAELSGLTPAAISQLEADERQPAFKTLTKLAEALQTSVSFLLGEHRVELPPDLKAFFRDLEDLDAADVAKVRDYAEYLRFQAREKSK